MLSTDATPAAFALLLAFRIVNALTLRTFFQPDEFFQSLEPAWQLAFGPASNAWITWEWRRQLRSSLHPYLFAAVYQVAARLARWSGLLLPDRAELVLVAPKVTQAVIAALLDYYTWKLAEKAYGRRSRTALITLVLSICSPWQWFCSTRTLSNCIETSITAIAVYYWPWHWPGSSRDRETRHQKQDQTQKQEQKLHQDSGGQAIPGALSQLRLSLLLAAFACVLRPTNVLIWLSLSVPTFAQASTRLRYVLVREILFCGSAVLACSVLSDRAYYEVWTLPPVRFLYFNIAQSLAVFYGINRPDYYLTEGLPLLLTTCLPFAVVGIWHALSGRPVRASLSVSNESKDSSSTSDDGVPHRILSQLSWISIIVTLSLSVISHKEVRFLYPILPFLHVLAAGPLSNFIPRQPSISRKAILTLLLTLNLLIAGYTSQVHQRGVIDVLSYIRHKHEAANSLSSSISGKSTEGESIGSNLSNTTVGFLMPCHSTPWRSHLIYPEINAWALSCEPPVDVPIADRASYVDEADDFYLSSGGPAAWLKANMEDLQTVAASGSRSGQHWMRQDPKFKRKYRRQWPRNLVFFEQLAPILGPYLEGSRYRECWRGFNSHFHDDWRRRGDVLVWCID